MPEARYEAGKSNIWWKLAMAWLWVRHPAWSWRHRKPQELIIVPPHTFGGSGG